MLMGHPPFDFASAKDSRGSRELVAGLRRLQNYGEIFHHPAHLAENR
jgi:hypothetical protein